MIRQLFRLFQNRKSRTLARLSLYGGVIMGLASGCGGEFVPKPKGYHKIDLPEHAYQTLDLKVPYTFRYSKSATATLDTSGYSEPYWVDLYYPAFDATVEFTYKALPGPTSPDLNKHIELARKLANKHQVKASSIDEQVRPTGTGKPAFVFRLSGQVPTQYQFYVTDSAHHFLRAALYFKTATKNDSLAPVIEYIAADMDTLLRSLQWRKL